MTDTGPPLKDWQNFFVIVGTSAGALMGLQFVVLALVTQARVAGSRRDIAAFGTPTVIHFCTALLISALMTAPWQITSGLGSCLTVFGALGLAYSLRVIWHARNADYQPDGEDWCWYVAIPLIAHLALIGAGVLTWWRTDWSFITVAVSSLVFLLLGVHNSWDTVTFVALKHGRTQPDPTAENTEQPDPDTKDSPAR